MNVYYYCKHLSAGILRTHNCIKCCRVMSLSCDNSAIHRRHGFGNSWQVTCRKGRVRFRKKTFWNVTAIFKRHPYGSDSLKSPATTTTTNESGTRMTSVLRHRGRGGHRDSSPALMPACACVHVPACAR